MEFLKLMLAILIVDLALWFFKIRVVGQKRLTISVVSQPHWSFGETTLWVYQDEYAPPVGDNLVLKTKTSTELYTIVKVVTLSSSQVKLFVEAGEIK